MKFPFGLAKNRRLLAAASALLLSACSALQFGYNNSPEFLKVYLSGKIDLYDEQQVILDASLKQLLAWHRQNEMPRIESELVRMQNLASQAIDNNQNWLSYAELEAIRVFVADSLERTATAAAPLTADLLLSLWPNQIAEVQQAFDDSNKDYLSERLDLSDKDRRQQASERMQDRFETWLDELTDEQVEMINQWAASRPDEAKGRYEVRVQRQKQFMKIVSLAANRQTTHADLTRDLQAWINDWQDPSKMGTESDTRQAREAVMQLVLKVLNSSTRGQKQFLADRLESWSKDTALIARGE